jgi:hypothetical protein
MLIIQAGLLRMYSNAGGRPETDIYIKWIDYTVRTLVQAVGTDHASAAGSPSAR